VLVRRDLLHGTAGKWPDFGCGGGNYLARMQQFGWGVGGTVQTLFTEHYICNLIH